jgi:branched-chain amino acid transport system substrate-binding protein
LRLRNFALIICLLAASCTAIAGCTAQTKNSDKIEGKTLTIYSSLPLVGGARAQGLAMENGVRLAWEQRHHRAGDFTIKYISLNDATVKTGKWDPEQTFNNAQKAVDDDKTIVYIGEFNSGATAISLPVLNKEGIPQIGPGSSIVGLTSKGPGAATGEPDKYRPSEKLSYVRTLPPDNVQGAAMADLMKEKGCKTLAIFDDSDVFGESFARTMNAVVPTRGIRIIDGESIDPQAKDYQSNVQKLKAEHPDCFLFSGTSDNNAAEVFKEVAAALPRAQLFGPSGVANSALADPKTGVPASVAARIVVTAPFLPASEYSEAGKRFFDAYKTTYHQDAQNTYAIFGYDAMNLALDAITKAGKDGNDRKKVTEELFAVRNREAPQGLYSINGNGDPSLSTYGVYTFRNGRLVFQKKINTAKG